MKIVVIAPPRTGSTSLLTSLSQSLNLKVITIPESYIYPDNFKLIEHAINSDNVIVRTGIRVNHGFPIQDFLKFFDYTILLSRKNNDEHKISFANLYYKHFYTNTGYHNVYTKDELPNTMFQSEHFISYFNNNIIIEKQFIKELSDKESIPIIYYEDLYQSSAGPQLIKNLIPELNLDKFLNCISNTKKIRINLEKKII
jgi:hypothetical protein